MNLVNLLLFYYYKRKYKNVCNYNQWYLIKYVAKIEHLYTIHKVIQVFGDYYYFVSFNTNILLKNN